MNASDDHDVKLVGRELPEVSISALDWSCVYVLGQRQHPGVLSARSTGGLSKGNELVFSFSDSKISGSSSVVIPFDTISSVAQGNIALVFPVSIEVQAAGVLHVFAHFVNRDRVFRQMRDLFQNYQHMATALSQSKAHAVSVRSTVESIARRLKDVDDMFISFHNMSEHFDQFCDMSERLGLQLRQRYPVHVVPSPVPQASTPAELAAILAAAGAANSAGSSKSSRQKKSEAPPLPPLPPALFEGWVNVIPESEQLAAAAAEADAANAKVGFFSGMVKTIKESAAQTDAKLLASVPLAIRKSAKNARYCAMGREGSCKLYSDEPTPINEKTVVREVIPLFGCVCSLQQRAVNKLASKFGVSSDDAMLKQIKIADASGRPLLLFTPFEPADLAQFLSAAQMSAMTPHEDPAEQPSSKASSDADPDIPATDSPTAPLAPVPAGDNGSHDNVSCAIVAVSDVKGEPEVSSGHSPLCEPATPPPALHPNAVAETSIHGLMKQMRDSIRRLASFVDHVLNSTSLADEVSTEFCVDYERMEACVIQRDWELQFAALELQSLKYELEVERARSAAIELRNKQLQAQLDMAGDNVSFTGLPAFSASDRSRRPSIAPSALAPVHLQVQGMGLDGAGEGVSVSSARALATSGHRRGSTALQMPHMNSSIPEFVDPRVANEPVQCAQKTEKGLSGYAYNKQTGLVNKYWKRRWCELVGSQMTMFTLLPSGELQPKLEINVAGCSLGKQYKEYSLSFSIIMNDKEKTSHHFLVLDQGDFLLWREALLATGCVDK